MSEKIYLSTRDHELNKMDKENPRGTGNLGIGNATTASLGTNSVALCNNSISSSTRCFAFGGGQAVKNDSIAFGYQSLAQQASCIAIGLNATAGQVAASGANSNIAIGTIASAMAMDGIAIGSNTKAIGRDTIAIGTNSKSGKPTVSAENASSEQRSIAIGYNASAQKSYCISIGQNSTADAGTDPSKNGSIVIGSNNLTTNYGSVVIGCESSNSNTYGISVGAYNTGDAYVNIGHHNNVNSTVAMVMGIRMNAPTNNTSHVAIGVGTYNLTQNNARFVVGNGVYINSAASNCFRVTDSGVYAKGNYNASGADYAEMFEWADGNPNNEDRVGRFVMLDGENISFAESEDAFILGIVSAAPSICGDSASEDWQGRIERDVFGRMLFEDIEVPAETVERIDEETGETVIEVISEAHTMNWYKQNPNWDNKQEYTPREDRPEWDPVGLLGKLVMIDDDTAEINGWVKPTTGGIATKSDHQTKFRVMSRIDNSHIKVLILS